MVERFEDLRCWQVARELRNWVTELTRAELFKADPELRSQIRDASLSAMANLSEGFCRRTSGQLAYHFNVAIGSAGEVQSHLYAALDEGLCAPGEFQHGYDLAASVQRLAKAFVASTRR